MKQQTNACTVQYLIFVGIELCESFFNKFYQVLLLLILYMFMHLK